MKKVIMFFCLFSLFSTSVCLSEPNSVGLEIGYPIFFGYIAQNPVTVNPPFTHLGVRYITYLLEDQLLLLEGEVSYMGYTWQLLDGSVENRVHSLQTSVSAGIQIRLLEMIALRGKFGIGYMALSTQASALYTDEIDAGWSGLFSVLLAAEISFPLTSKIDLGIETEFVLAQDVNTSFGDIDFVLTPSLSVDYLF